MLFPLHVFVIPLVSLASITTALDLPNPAYTSSLQSSLRQHHTRTFVNLHYPVHRQQRSSPSQHHFHKRTRNHLGRPFLRFLTVFSSEKNTDSNDGGKNYGKKTKKFKQIKTSVIDGFTDRIENLLQSVGIARETYKFGDYTRSAVSGATRVSEDAVRTVTGNEEYQFGDITKNITRAAVNVTENTIRSISGEQSYQFGDITKGVISDLTDSAEDILLETDVDVALIVDLLFNIYTTLPSSRLVGRFFQELGLRPNKNDDINNNNTKKNAMTTTLQLVAFIGLTLHFVLNMCHSGNIIAAWGYTWWSMGVSPLESNTSWQSFLSMQATIRIFVGPLMLPLQAVLTFFLSLIYRDFITLFLEQRLLIRMPWWGPRMKNRYPVLTRFIAFFFAYLGNCFAVAGITAMGCSSVGVLYRFLVEH